MPSCCLKHCKNRTYKHDTKGITYYRFPKEVTRVQQWLNACKLDKSTFKVDSARICSNHFDSNCFVIELTKPRSKNTQAKELKRLKKDSVPCKMLVLNAEEKRNEIVSQKETVVENTQSKVDEVQIRSVISTYTPLVQYAKIKQSLSREETISNMEAGTIRSVEGKAAQSKEVALEDMEVEIARNMNKPMENVEKQNNTTKRDINKGVRKNNIPVKTLMTQLRNSEETKQELLEDNQHLKQINGKLSREIIQLQDEILKLKKKTHKEAEAIATNALRKVFTPGQISMLLSTSSRVQWSSEDIMSAISLRSLSPKAYKYLRKVKRMPLPCLTTLHNWVAKFNVFPGLLKEVLNIMSTKGRDFSTADKLTVLTFDDLYVSNQLDIDRKQQKVYGLHKTCLFIMARGLFKKWRQPIYYNYDTPISRDILFTVIRHLYEIGYIVIAVTCDMGPINMRLWKDLHIGVYNPSHSKNMDIENNCSIIHPANESLKIFFYADVPHLLKLARNNLLDSGFTIKGTLVDKTCFEQLLKLNNGDLKICHKLSSAHLDAKGTQRQNVKLAAQIFSNTNAVAMKWCGENGFLDNTQWKQTSETVQLFNDWFDICNSSVKYAKSSLSHAYGVSIEEQNKILNNMNEFMMEMRVGRRKSLLQFQKGILLCNRSLQEMFAYLKEQYSPDIFDIQYVLTRRLNQDILENFFSYIRSMGSGYDHPTPVEIKNRLKWYILGKHSEHVLSEGRNIEEDSCDSLITMTDVPELDSIYLEDRLAEEEEERNIFLNISQVGQNSDHIREEIGNHNKPEDITEGMKENGN